MRDYYYNPKKIGCIGLAHRFSHSVFFAFNRVQLQINKIDLFMALKAKATKILICYIHALLRSARHEGLYKDVISYNYLPIQKSLKIQSKISSLYTLPKISSNE